MHVSFLTLNEKVKHNVILRNTMQLQCISDYIGVADGVGGWRSRGYDPSAFSSSLLTICKDIAQKKPMHDPYRLIDNSYKKV